MKLSLEEKVKLYKEKQYNPSGVDYEKYIINELNSLGYHSYGTKASGDQGADILLKLNKYFSIVIQCKFYKSSISNSAIQEVLGAKQYYNANLAVVITNNRFTKSAKELAEVNKVLLIDFFNFGQDIVKIIEMLGLYPKKYLDKVALELNHLKYENLELQSLIK